MKKNKKLKLSALAVGLVVIGSTLTGVAAPASASYSAMMGPYWSQSSCNYAKHQFLIGGQTGAWDCMKFKNGWHFYGYRL